MPSERSAQVLPFSSRPADHIHDGGYFRFYRRLFTEGDSVVGTNRKYIGAWAEIIGTATWQDEGRDVQFGESWIHLARGQLVLDYRRLAHDWEIPDGTFYSLLQRMRKEGRIRLDRRRVRAGNVVSVTVCTVVNFDLYQAPSEQAAFKQPSRRLSLTGQEVTDRRQDTIKAPSSSESKEEKEGKKERESLSRTARESTEAAIAAAPDGDHDLDPDAILYAKGKQLLGKAAGGQITKLKKLVGLSKAMGVIAAARHKQDPSEYVAGVIKSHAAAQPPQMFDPVSGMAWPS